MHSLPARPRPDDVPLTIASYNIHKARGLDRRTDLSRIADVIAELDADVVGIQEVYGPQAEALAERLGLRAIVAPIHERADGWYGNAVLTRLTVRDHGTFDLTRRRREPRGGVRVDMVVDGRDVHLFNVHFGLRVWERAEQVELLVQRHVLSEELPGPRIVVGDLNEWFPGAVGRTLRRQLLGARVRRTHPAPLPLFALDRIYWDRALHGDGVRVHRSRLARIASDHLPIVARLRLPRLIAAPHAG